MNFSSLTTSFGIITDIESGEFSKIQILSCEMGHPFVRAATRGRPATVCPAHRSVMASIAPKSTETNENGMVTLTCAAGGHTWERASQRGRIPHNCPSHSVVKAPKMVMVDDLDTPQYIPTAQLTGAKRAEALFAMMTSLASRERFIIVHPMAVGKGVTPLVTV